MEAVFLKLLNMSIAAGWLVLMVIVLRRVLKNAPKWMRCVLWALVAIRLICPFSVESVLSLIPSAETVPDNIMYMEEPRIHSGIGLLNSVVNPVLSESLTPTVGDSVNPVQVITFVASILWIVGMIAMLIYAGVSYLKIRGKVSAAIWLEEDVAICDYIDTPFILGIRRPRIYIPSNLAEDKTEYVIAHERAHLERHDHWWKPLGFILLTVYWFHPLMWVAYVLLCRDIELACDEKVIKELGEGDKKAYSDALLYCSVPRRMIMACPLAFGEVGVQERVRTVLNYKKPAFWMLVSAVLVCVIVAVCFLTNPKKDALVAPVPFARTYHVEEVVYDAPQLSSCYTVTPNSQYSFSADYAMYDKVSGQWIYRGGMQETALTKDYFEEYFQAAEGNAGWADGYSAGKLRRNNLTAWELVIDEAHDGVQDGDLSYYLLQQKDGDVYLVCWYYDPEREADPYSDDSFIRWVLKLARADYVSCNVETVGADAYYDMPWYPLEDPEQVSAAYHSEDKSWEAYLSEAVLTHTLYGNGTLWFSVNDITDSLTILEEYYEYDGEVYQKVKTGDYTLVPGKDGRFRLDISRRSERKAGYGIYQVPYEDGVYTIKVEFPLYSGDDSLLGNYISSECLYMNPLSSTMSFGDSGKTYQFTEEALIITDKHTGDSQSVVPEDWQWRELPYTDEEWDALFIPGAAEINVSEQYQERLYLRLSGRYRLLLMDGELWLVSMAENPRMGEYIWSIYTLVEEIIG